MSAAPALKKEQGERIALESQEKLEASVHKGRTVDGASHPQRFFREGAPAQVIQGNKNAVPEQNAPRAPLRIVPATQEESNEETAEALNPNVPSNYQQQFEEEPERDYYQPRYQVPPVQADVPQEQQGREEGLKEKAMEVLDEASLAERGEFNTIFWSSLVETFGLAVIFWYFYWAFSKIKRLPKAFLLSKWQKITMVLLTILFFFLTMLIIYLLADYLCTGFTGFLAGVFAKIANFTTGTDYGFGAVCEQFKGVFQQIGQ